MRYTGLLVLSMCTLLYNTETWTMKEKQKQRLRVFEMACLWKIEGFTRRDRIRNEEIFKRLNIIIGIGLIDRIRIIGPYGTNGYDTLDI